MLMPADVDASPLPHGAPHMEPEGQSTTCPDQPRILIVEDDVPLAQFLCRGLENERFRVDVRHDGQAAIQAFASDSYDLLLLDLNLPVLDGMDVLQRLRPAHPDLAVLVLTARGNLDDRVLALNAGADDCLNKPFSFFELTARLRALLRRSGKANSSLDTLQVGDLILKRSQRRVERAGRRIDLTLKEFALLEFLMLQPGQPATRRTIVEKVWKIPYDPRSNLVDVYVKYVRDKIDQQSSSKLLRTLRGIGYVVSAT